MTRARQTNWERAHKWASKHKLKAPKQWPIESLGIYWWGLHEGFQAGLRAGRRSKR
jgi:hypothetical protein